jgi:hypothetical protein
VSVRFRPLVLLLAGVLAVVAGCKDRPYPLKFNNGIARAMDKLRRASIEFYSAVKAHENGAADANEVRTKYQAVEKTLKQIKEEYDDIGPPLGTNWGQQMMDLWTDFLDGQQTILDKYFSPIVQMVESGRPDWDRIHLLLDGVDKEEAKTRNTLVEFQKSWAKDHNFKLEHIK